MFYYLEAYFWTIFIVQGVIFGLATSYLAEQKNKDKATWFMIGFFTGFIGLIIIAASKPEEESRTSFSTTNSNYAKSNIASKKTNKIPVRFVDLNSPVEIAEIEIIIEDMTNFPYLGVSFRNLSSKALTGVKFKAILFDSFREPVEEAHNNEIKLTLQDQNADTKKIFGESKNYPLSDYPTARLADIIIENVRFADGTQWKRENETLKEINEIATISETKLSDLKKMAGEDALTYPYEDEDTWICVCGRHNKKENEICIRCDREKEIIFREYTEESIDKKIIMEEEKRQREEETRRQQEERNKKKYKKITIGASIVIILVVLAIVILPIYKNFSQYNKATKLYEEGKYDEAIKLYKDLGDHKDSNEKVIEIEKLLKEKNSEKKSVIADVSDQNNSEITTQTEVPDQYKEEIKNQAEFELSITPMIDEVTLHLGESIEFTLTSNRPGVYPLLNISDWLDKKEVSPYTQSHEVVGESTRIYTLTGSDVGKVMITIHAYGPEYIVSDPIAIIVIE